MKVLIISGSYPPMLCGVGAYTKNLATALAKYYDIKVSVLTDCAATTEDASQASTVFPLVKYWRFSDLKTIYRVILRFKPDIIHIQYPTPKYKGIFPALLPCLIAPICRCIVQTWHEIEENNVRGCLIRSLSLNGLITVRPRYLDAMPRLIHTRLKRKPHRYIANAAMLEQLTVNKNDIDIIKKLFTVDNRRLIAYFGLIYPNKGVEQLFKIANPATDHIVIVGGIPEDASSSHHDYLDSIKELIHSEKWQSHATLTGYLNDREAARVLAAADAVIFPFVDGGGIWNTSVQAAKIQGTFIIMTSKSEYGYNQKEHIYYTPIGDVDEMRHALNRYAGKKNTKLREVEDGWKRIAHEHITFYQSIIQK